jgi:hypothetical protein
MNVKSKEVDLHILSLKRKGPPYPFTNYVMLAHIDERSHQLVNANIQIFLLLEG